MIVVGKAGEHACVSLVDPRLTTNSTASENLQKHVCNTRDKQGGHHCRSVSRRLPQHFQKFSEVVQVRAAAGSVSRALFCRVMFSHMALDSPAGSNITTIASSTMSSTISSHRLGTPQQQELVASPSMGMLQHIKTANIFAWFSLRVLIQQPLDLSCHSHANADQLMPSLTSKALHAVNL